MIKRIKNLGAIALCLLAIALTAPSALADGNSETADRAAQEVVKETGAKEQFGESPNGDRLLDNAKVKANQKLNDLSEEAKSPEDLPDSKKLFLKNLESD